ncbi:MAG TPA: hypothetical protein VJU61_21270, partial [Polyangiaceae bacterium]|nr:hypothetical protein [Polyangiaceae bacterium]
LSVEKLRGVTESAEVQLAAGRRDEAIAILSGVVESPRFLALKGLDEGRAAVFTLGDALGRAGAYPMARDYLVRLLGTSPVDTWYRRAVSSLVDFGLASGDPQAFLEVLAGISGGADEPWAGDVAYLRGMLAERGGAADQALAAYAQVTPRSRFWAQATYRSGLIDVEQRRFGDGEQKFCKVADAKQTPKLAPLFGGNDFFRVRDLSRLALGRVSHEQYRFDDARYYYHLVPGDSERLPEALYESATSRYEAKDYAAAHSLLNELSSLERAHPYTDEAWILDAYVDLAQCQFPRADAKLQEFLKRYEPVLEAARRLKSDPRALSALLAGQGTDTQGALGLGSPPEVTRLLATSIRLDPTYGVVTRQLADLDHQLSGLDGAARELGDLAARLLDPGAVQARPAVALANTPADRLRALSQQTAALRRMLRESSVGASSAAPDLALVKQDLIRLEAEAAAFESAVGPVRSAEPGAETPGGSAASLEQLLGSDAQQARELSDAARSLRGTLVEQQSQLGREALDRLERRLTRLVRRARAGRIETVLGRKQALELEVEALSQGFLPPGAVDSLDAARYLADDEEYWPFDGEDWDDEYVGGEGLR